MQTNSLKTSVLIRILNIFKNAIFPTKCLLCNRLFHNPYFDNNYKKNFSFELLVANFLCNECKSGIQRVKSPICSVCGLMFKSMEGENHICGECIKKPKYFKTARAFSVYDGDMRSLIHALKFKEKLQVAPGLSKLLFSTFITNQDINSIDIVVPVPLHVKRLRQRGFNQALLLVKDWGSLAQDSEITQFKIQIDPHVLVRNRYTKPQIGLGKKGRIANIKNTFRVCEPCKIKGKKVLIVDDVFTTGATVDECAKTLLSAGALQVDVLTLARVMQ